jgi:hypothetical protein
MLPSLAALEDLAARIPGDISEEDYARAEAALADASAMVRTEAGQTWVDAEGELADVPDVAVAVTIAAARRAFVNPEMLASESIQDYSSTFSSPSSDIYLTKQERTALRRITGRSGLWTQATTRSDVGPDTPSVRPHPWGSTPSEEYDPLAEGWVG